jgi:hypothetical protein
MLVAYRIIWVYNISNRHVGRLWMIPIVPGEVQIINGERPCLPENQPLPKGCVIVMMDGR